MNDLVAFEPRSETFSFTFDPTGCPEEIVGKFNFEARLTNTTGRALSDLFAEVTALTNGNLLQNANGGPGGVGSRLTVLQQGQFTDGVLISEEFVDVTFILCLQEQQPFQFVVDVFGVVDMDANAQVRAQLVK